MEEIAALKKIIRDALASSSALALLVGTEIYDVNPGVSGTPKFPYISFGRFSSEDSDAECFDSYEVVGQIDIYSSGTGKAASTAEALEISKIVRQIIRDIPDDIPLQDGNTLSEVKYRSKAVITAQDGKTKHVAMTIAAIVDED